MIQHINRNNNKTHMILLIDTEKAFGKNPTPFHYKSAKEARKRSNVPQHNKNIYDKTRVNIILNGQQLKWFPIKSGMR
jgi:hypothetical protein